MTTVDRREMLQVLGCAAGSFLISGEMPMSIPAAHAVPAVTQSAAPAERVLGVGGIFFRARDPKALTAWYAEHLGVTPAPGPWQTAAGPTSFTPFPQETKYIGTPEHAWMINFRVRDLDKMVAQLRAANVEVTVDPQAYPYGRFARTHDPEGNAVELWEAVEKGE